MAVIGNNNRKSVLEEDASLYRAKDEKTEKQKWSEMNREERVNYFMDYYFLKCLALLLVIGVVAGIVKHMLEPQTPVVMSVAVVENSLTPDGEPAFREFLEQLCITDEGNQEVVLDDDYPTGYESLAKLQAYFNTNGIDLIITNEEHFKEMAEIGYFEDLNALMPEFAKARENYLCYAPEPTDDTSATELSETNAQTDTVSGENAADTEPTLRAYGVRITDCAAFKDAWGYDSEAVAGIVVSKANEENAEKVLTALFEE